MDTKITVIIPVYNRASIIKRTMDSALSQTYDHLEIIVVDDCSDDFTELSNLMDSYHDNRILLLRNKKRLKF